MKVVGLFVSVVFFVGLARAFAEGFRPGNVFVSDLSFKYCHDGSGQVYPDLIWEIDPQTGEATVFAVLGGTDCGVVSGLAVSPDGCRLRVAQSLQSRILEFAPDGTWTVVLDHDDGISSPVGTNCLAYDAESNFYVVNAGSSNILRFPADGEPGTIFADASDGVGGGGSIAFSADGDLYLANWAPDQVIRVTPNGASSLFRDYEPIGSLGSIAADLGGHIHIELLTSDERSGIYTFNQGDSSSEHLLTSDAIGAMIPAPIQTEVYAAFFGRLRAVRLSDGAVRQVAQDLFYGSGITIAPLTLGDLNRSRTVDVFDWRALQACMQGPEIANKLRDCHYANLDHDHDVDLADVSVFQRSFGTNDPECP